MDSIFNNPYVIAVVAVLSIARISRLIVHDHWPPIVWVRDRYVAATAGGWELLMKCHFCVSIYVSFGIWVWGTLADFDLIWWAVNGPLAAAYLAAYVVTYDGDDG